MSDMYEIEVEIEAATIQNWFMTGAKLYTPSTPNIDFIQWHTHLIVCAVK